MKKILTILIVLHTLTTIHAQTPIGITGETNWAVDWTNFKPKTTEYKKPNEILSGIISEDRTLTRNKTYLLSGVVYVTNKAKLTIESGTVIRGDYETCGTLVITKGASVIAQGIETSPIVFTSAKEAAERKPGDWGGIIILGDAPINKIGGTGLLAFDLDAKLSSYGGENEAGNSGILKFVRIEFAGRKLNAQKELNGLSLAGVGNKTKLESIQISYSNDDSFEAYGGNLNLNNLISFRATDDDFDFTQGAQCNISNSLAIRYPYSSDISTSRCFEIDFVDKVETTDFSKKQTFINASNLTFINNQENNQGLVKEAVYISDYSALTLKNSVVYGFNKCLLIDQKIDPKPTVLEKIKIENIFVSNCNGNIESENSSFTDQVEEWFKNPKFHIMTSTAKKETLFYATDNKETDFDFRLLSPKNSNTSN